ncbi:MAG: hypothetical protein AAF840_08705 [Bacteroidota bacterium]
MPSIIEATAASLNRHAVAYNPNIQQQMRQQLEYERIFTVRASDNVWSAPNVTSGEVVQPYQSGFTPKNSVTFDATELKLQKIKIDLSFDADDLEKWFESWRVEWHEIGKDEAAWSFPRYIYDTILMPKIIEEMNINAFKGLYAAPATGVAGLSINSVTGLIERLKAGVTAGEVVEIVTGAIDGTNAVNKVETFCDGLPELYRDLPGTIYTDKTVEKNYFRDYRNQFGTGNGVAGNENNELRVDGTDKRVVGLHGLSGTGGLIFVPNTKQNFVWGTRIGSPTMPSIRWKDNDIRVLKGTTELYRFYGYEYPKEVFINDNFSA